MQLPEVLLCDTDTAFSQKAAEELKSSVTLTVAKTPLEAKNLVCDTKKRFSVLCVDAGFEKPYSLPMIRHFKSYRPATPICIIAQTPDQLLGEQERKKLHVEHSFVKPLEPRELIQKIIPVSFFESEKLRALSSQENSQTGDELSLMDSGMHPIDAGSFLCGKVSFFDVYIRLSEKRFLMLLKAGEEFGFDRLATYLKKGVKYFYIKKNAHLYYLQYCDKLTETILNNPTISVETKTKQVMNLGAETMSFLKDNGVSEISLQSAHRFVSFSHELIKKNELNKSPHVSSLLENAAAMEHGGGVVFILSLLLEAQKFQDRKVINGIAMGGMLHDIGLYQLPERLHEEWNTNLTKEEQKQFETHPMIGFEILAGVPRVDPMLLQVVKQHHERRNHKGFPANLGPGSISPVAEMVGIADVFHQLLLRKVKEPEIDVFEEMRAHHADSFSFTILEAFRKAFSLKDW